MQILLLDIKTGLESFLPGRQGWLGCFSKISGFRIRICKPHFATVVIQYVTALITSSLLHIQQVSLPFKRVTANINLLWFLSHGPAETDLSWRLFRYSLCLDIETRSCLVLSLTNSQDETETRQTNVVSTVSRPSRLYSSSFPGIPSRTAVDITSAVTSQTWLRYHRSIVSPSKTLSLFEPI
ncbi:hypothetical protein PROFUN_14422 [Planoprotostelium fungivorum]|uniref:Uncharacterized protein n=1 Tax=Planoprotostelium fungivorum TaxID=1890364 RepID=A0A2P6MXE4_9EUKA|nr:hypothetical protein PROFUN_14422 [Planoprotostelium fungivorum]